MSRFNIIPKGSLEFSSVASFPTVGDATKTYVAKDTYATYRWSNGQYEETTPRYCGTPRYNGIYLKASYLEFSEICSPTPIEWEVGDWVYYTRTGMRYRLYSIPQPKKIARRNSYGSAFIYSNVQFYAATESLDVAPFRDLVIGDNLIHFSTQPDISTYAPLLQIAERLQANMDDFEPGQWLFRIYSGLDSDTKALVEEAREFSVSGVSCLGAMDKVYEVWEDIGWIHTYESVTYNGETGYRNVITFGRPNLRSADNTTDPYLYGKGNGLVSIKKTQANKDEMATRLYVYGSSTNMLTNFYNNLEYTNPVTGATSHIKDSESVNIVNLMLPLSEWRYGSDGLRDARGAYIENADAIAKYGLIPKTVYFDGSEQEEVYPSIYKMTAGNLRTAKTALNDTSYVPRLSTYPDSYRLDQIKAVTNPTDNGLASTDDGKKYVDLVEFRMENKSHSTDEETFTKTFEIGTSSLSKSGTVTADLTLDGYCGFAYESGAYDQPATKDVYVKLTFANGSIFTLPIELTRNSTTLKYALAKSKRYTLKEVPSGSFSVALVFDISYEGNDEISLGYAISVTSLSLKVTTSPAPSETFKLTIPQIGFDIATRAALTSQGIATISMKDGMCGGRSFAVKSSTYDSDTDSWVLEMYRGLDESLNTYFPNSNYPIAVGDHYVLLDIVMPELYIYTASQRLLEMGNRLLADLSRIMPFYEPEIDAKVMATSGRTLLEGRYMMLTDSDIVEDSDSTDNVDYTDYILIDTLTINEGESNIPTYKVTLRERKKISFTQAISNATANALTSTASTSGTSGGGSGTSDYDKLKNKPSIDGVELSGDMASYKDLGLINRDFFELDSTSIPGKTLIKAKYDGLYSNGDISAFGAASGASGGGASGGVEYSAGQGINITGEVISWAYSVGSGLKLENGVISVDSGGSSEFVYDDSNDLVGTNIKLTFNDGTTYTIALGSDTVPSMYKYAGKDLSNVVKVEFGTGVKKFMDKCFSYLSAVTTIKFYSQTITMQNALDDIVETTTTSSDDLGSTSIRITKTNGSVSTISLGSSTVPGYYKYGGITKSTIAMVEFGSGIKNFESYSLGMLTACTTMKFYATYLDFKQYALSSGVDGQELPSNGNVYVKSGISLDDCYAIGDSVTFESFGWTTRTLSSTSTTTTTHTHIKTNGRYYSRESVNWSDVFYGETETFSTWGWNLTTLESLQQTDTGGGGTDDSGTSGGGSMNGTTTNPITFKSGSTASFTNTSFDGSTARTVKIPTKISHLSDDSSFVKESEISESNNDFYNAVVAVCEDYGFSTSTSGGSGGTGDTTPTEISTLKFQAGEFSTKSYNGKTAVTVNIPTKTSHLDNDSGFVTTQTLDGYSPTGHTHSISDVTGLQTTLNGLAPATHSHAISDVTNLETTLDAKLNASVFNNLFEFTGGVIKAKYDFMSVGEVSAFGASNGSGGFTAGNGISIEGMTISNRNVVRKPLQLVSGANQLNGNDLILDALNSNEQSTLTLPSSPYNGQEIEVRKMGCFSTLTIAPNGKTIKGSYMVVDLSDYSNTMIENVNNTTNLILSYGYTGRVTLTYFNGVWWIEGTVFNYYD